MALCRGPVCNRPVVAKGLCAAHYKQLKRDGVLHVIEDSKLPEDKFWKNINKTADGCWIWTGTVDKGYGRMYIGNKAYQAHRWSYEQHKHVSLTEEINKKFSQNHSKLLLYRKEKLILMIFRSIDTRRKKVSK